MADFVAVASRLQRAEAVKQTVLKNRAVWNWLPERNAVTNWCWRIGFCARQLGTCWTALLRKEIAPPYWKSGRLLDALVRNRTGPPPPPSILTFMGNFVAQTFVDDFHLVERDSELDLVGFDLLILKLHRLDPGPSIVPVSFVPLCLKLTVNVMPPASGPLIWADQLPVTFAAHATTLASAVRTELATFFCWCRISSSRRIRTAVGRRSSGGTWRQRR
jgi:hypothetical protein